MAEAFARIHGGGEIEAFSAGSKPSGKVNETAVLVMKELGYDLGKHGSKSLQDIPQETYDHIVTMGCGDACPWVPAKNRSDWEIPDPKKMPLEDFRKIRDLIETKVKELLLK